MSDHKTCHPHEFGDETEKLEIKPHPEKKVVNTPQEFLHGTHHTRDEIEKALHTRINHIQKEFHDGFHAIKQYPKSVTFFGSARLPDTSPHYQSAQKISERICREGYTVITGGGPGIMEAGNRGSKESCGYAVGFNIELPHEQVINPYVTHGVNFYYFFSRKVVLTFSAEAFLFFPGGFGTLDELFEILTLIQTKKIPQVPVIMVGSEFWNPLQKFIKDVLLEQFETISPEDIDLYYICDNEDQVIENIKAAKVHTIADTTSNNDGGVGHDH